MPQAGIKHCIALFAFMSWCSLLYAQQLKLGDPTSSPIKAALLELNTTNQGLLLPRVTDTTVSPLNVSPDGMIIYYKPASSLLVRRNGSWSKLADSTAVSNNQWLLSGNLLPDSTSKVLGSTTAQPLNIITNNTNRMIVSSGGNVGIGTTSPSTLLHLKTGVANTSGLRLENLNSSSTVTSGAGGLGVDANGNVVRAATPAAVYNTAGIVSQNIKIWADSVSNTSSGVATANLTSAGFTKILSITAVGKGGTGPGDSPIPVLSSYTLTSAVFNVFKGNSALIAILSGMAVDGDNTHKVYVTVIGY